MVTVQDLKEYLRIDSDEEDALLQHILDMALSYLRGAVEGFDDKLKEQDFDNIATMAVLVYAKEMYDNRDGGESLAPMARRLVTTLQCWG